MSRGIDALEEIDYMFYLERKYSNGEDYELHPHMTEAYTIAESELRRLDTIDEKIEICKKANEQKYVYVRESFGIVKEEFLDPLDYEVLNDRLYVNSRGFYHSYSLKGYGIYWALTEEELE